jgi:acyl-CoA thioesterase I
MFFLKKVTYLILCFSLICAVSCKVETKSETPKLLPHVVENVSNRAKIVAFGDSLTAGFGLTEKESFPYLLQQKLKSEGYEYEVLNAGVSGDTTAGGIERIDWSLEQENVQILILELGGNDLLRGLSPTKMKENLDVMIRKAKAKNVKILLCGMIAPPTMGSEYSKEFTFAFPDLAEKHKIEFLPFILENVALNPKLNQADGIHPNAEGEKIMTENVYKSLKVLLKK